MSSENINKVKNWGQTMKGPQETKDTMSRSLSFSYRISQATWTQMLTPMFCIFVWCLSIPHVCLGPHQQISYPCRTVERDDEGRHVWIVKGMTVCTCFIVPSGECQRHISSLFVLCCTCKLPWIKCHVNVNVKLPQLIFIGRPFPKWYIFSIFCYMYFIM